MAEPSAEMDAVKNDRGWERESTRQAILDAARQLAAREGAEAITLSRVAEEAGFAPPAVYAYFASKDDLHLAVVADDLEKLARAMRGEDGGDADAADREGVADTQDEELAADVIAFNRAVLEQEPSADQDIEQALGVADASASEDDAEDANVEGEISQPDDAEAETSSLAEIEQAIGFVLDEDDYVEPLPPGEEVPDAFPEEEIEATQAEAPADENDGAGEAAQDAIPVVAVPADVQAMQATIAELQQTVVRLEQRPVDSWLERRLRVFERTLADIEGRMEKVERDSAAALSTVSEGFKALEERFGDTQEGAERRVAESEQRHRAVTADLRHYVKDLSGRLGAVETSLSRMLEDPAVMRDVPEVVLPDVEEPSSDVPDEHDDDGSAEAPQALHEPSGESYLSAARRAAKSAAEEADRIRGHSPLGFLKMPELRATEAKKSGSGPSRRTLRIVAGVLTLVVALIGARIVLHGTAAAKPVPAATVTKTIAMTPDERVVSLAKAGNADAELIVALKLMNGDGVSPDVPSGAHWLRKSAAQKQPVAEYWLGTLYERGRGVDKDPAKAVSWYEASAKAGNAKAMYRLGVADAEGWTGEPNYVAAAEWFKKAARLGMIDAAFNLAVLYERGQGVPQSLTNAFAWYTIAARQGDAASKARLDALVSQITPEQVEKARAEAAKFHAAEPMASANVEPSVRQVAAEH